MLAEMFALLLYITGLKTLWRIPLLILEEALLLLFELNAEARAFSNEFSIQRATRDRRAAL